MTSASLKPEKSFPSARDMSFRGAVARYFREFRILRKELPKVGVSIFLLVLSRGLHSVIYFMPVKLLLIFSERRVPSYIVSVLGDITFDDLLTMAALASVSAVALFLCTTMVWRRFSISAAANLASMMSEPQVTMRVTITADIFILVACLISTLVLGPVIPAVLAMGVVFVYIGFFVRRIEANKRALPFGVDAYHLKQIMLFFLYFYSSLLIILQMLILPGLPLITAIMMLVVVRVASNASSRIGDNLFKLTSPKK